MLMNGAFFDELGKLAAAKSNFSVSQSRKGRRSMSVATLLRKDGDGSLLRHKLADAVGVQMVDGAKRVLTGPAAEQQLSAIQEVLPRPVAVFRGLQGLFDPDAEEEKAAEVTQEFGALYPDPPKSSPKKFKEPVLSQLGGEAKEAAAWSLLSKIADSTKPQWLEIPYTEGERMMQNVPVRSKSKPGDLPSADDNEPYTKHKSGFSVPETAIAPKVGCVMKFALAMPPGVKGRLDTDMGDAPDMDSQIVKRQDQPGYAMMIGTGRAPDARPITAVESDNTYVRD